VPYTGCDADASRIAFDKVLSKQHFTSAAVPTPHFLVVDDVHSSWPEGWVPPMVVKPIRQGSSVGLAFVERVEDWPMALQTAMAHDTAALVEEKIQGRETTVGILDGQALPVVEVRPRNGSYDYTNKYTKGATDYLCPAPFNSEVTYRIQKAGLSAYRAVGARDYARVDIMVDAHYSPIVLEVNTLPGMTETSLLPKAAQAAGIDYADLCEKMVTLALVRRPSRGVD
jgi:D-alanine-D-alanine ligase